MAEYHPIRVIGKMRSKSAGNQSAVRPNASPAIVEVVPIVHHSVPAESTSKQPSQVTTTTTTTGNPPDAARIESAPKMSRILTEHQQRTVRICIVGGISVGKTCLGVRFAQGIFKGKEHEPTIDDSYRKSIVLEGGGAPANKQQQQQQHQIINVEIIDSASIGSYSTPSTREKLWRMSDAFISTFSLTDQESLPIAGSFIRDIRAIKGENVPCCLVGMKSDNISERKISEPEAKALALSLGVSYIEASAIDGTNVEALFRLLVGAVIVPRRGEEKANDPAFQRRISSRRLLRTVSLPRTDSPGIIVVNVEGPTNQIL